MAFNLLYMYAQLAKLFGVDDAAKKFINEKKNEVQNVLHPVVSNTPAVHKQSILRASDNAIFLEKEAEKIRYEQMNAEREKQAVLTNSVLSVPVVDNTSVFNSVYDAAMNNRFEVQMQKPKVIADNIGTNNKAGKQRFGNVLYDLNLETGKYQARLEDPYVFQPGEGRRADEDDLVPVFVNTQYDTEDTLHITPQNKLEIGVNALNGKIDPTKPIVMYHRTKGTFEQMDLSMLSDDGKRAVEQDLLSYAEDRAKQKEINAKREALIDRTDPTCTTIRDIAVYNTRVGKIPSEIISAIGKAALPQYTLEDSYGIVEDYINKGVNSNYYGQFGEVLKQKGINSMVDIAKLFGSVTKYNGENVYDLLDDTFLRAGKEYGKNGPAAATPKIASNIFQQLIEVTDIAQGTDALKAIVDPVIESYRIDKKNGDPNCNKNVIDNLMKTCMTTLAGVGDTAETVLNYSNASFVNKAVGGILIDLIQRAVDAGYMDERTAVHYGLAKDENGNYIAPSTKYTEFNTNSAPLNFALELLSPADLAIGITRGVGKGILKKDLEKTFATHVDEAADGAKLFDSAVDANKQAKIAANSYFRTGDSLQDILRTTYVNKAANKYIKEFPLRAKGKLTALEQEALMKNIYSSNLAHLDELQKIADTYANTKMSYMVVRSMRDINSAIDNIDEIVMTVGTLGINKVVKGTVNAIKTTRNARALKNTEQLINNTYKKVVDADGDLLKTIDTLNKVNTHLDTIQDICEKYDMGQIDEGVAVTAYECLFKGNGTFNQIKQIFASDEIAFADKAAAVDALVYKATGGKVSKLYSSDFSDNLDTAFRATDFYKKLPASYTVDFDELVERYKKYTTLLPNGTVSEKTAMLLKHAHDIVGTLTDEFEHFKDKFVFLSVDIKAVKELFGGVADDIAPAESMQVIKSLNRLESSMNFHLYKDTDIKYVLQARNAFNKAVKNYADVVNSANYINSLVTKTHIPTITLDPMKFNSSVDNNSDVIQLLANALDLKDSAKLQDVLVNTFKKNTLYLDVPAKAQYDAAIPNGFELIKQALAHLHTVPDDITMQELRGFVYASGDVELTQVFATIADQLNSNALIKTIDVQDKIIKVGLSKVRKQSMFLGDTTFMSAVNNATAQGTPLQEFMWRAADATYENIGPTRSISKLYSILETSKLQAQVCNEVNALDIQAGIKVGVLDALSDARKNNFSSLIWDKGVLDNLSGTERTAEIITDSLIADATAHINRRGKVNKYADFTTVKHVDVDGAVQTFKFNSVNTEGNIYNMFDMLGSEHFTDARKIIDEQIIANGETPIYIDVATVSDSADPASITIALGKDDVQTFVNKAIEFDGITDVTARTHFGNISAESAKTQYKEFLKTVRPEQVFENNNDFQSALNEALTKMTLSEEPKKYRIVMFNSDSNKNARVLSNYFRKNNYDLWTVGKPFDLAVGLRDARVGLRGIDQMLVPTEADRLALSEVVQGALAQIRKVSRDTDLHIGFSREFSYKDRVNMLYIKGLFGRYERNTLDGQTERLFNEAFGGATPKFTQTRKQLDALIESFERVSSDVSQFDKAFGNIAIDETKLARIMSNVDHINSEAALFGEHTSTDQLLSLNTINLYSGSTAKDIFDLALLGEQHTSSQILTSTKRVVDAVNKIKNSIAKPYYFGVFNDTYDLAMRSFLDVAPRTLTNQELSMLAKSMRKDLDPVTKFAVTRYIYDNTVLTWTEDEALKYVAEYEKLTLKDNKMGELMELLRKKDMITYKTGTMYSMLSEVPLEKQALMSSAVNIDEAVLEHIDNIAKELDHMRTQELARQTATSLNGYVDAVEEMMAPLKTNVISSIRKFYNDITRDIAADKANAMRVLDNRASFISNMEHYSNNVRTRMHLLDDVFTKDLESSFKTVLDMPDEILKQYIVKYSKNVMMVDLDWAFIKDSDVISKKFRDFCAHAEDIGLKIHTDLANRRMTFYYDLAHMTDVEKDRWLREVSGADVSLDAYVRNAKQKAFADIAYKQTGYNYFNSYADMINNLSNVITDPSFLLSSKNIMTVESYSNLLELLPSSVTRNLFSVDHLQDAKLFDNAYGCNIFTAHNSALMCGAAGVFRQGSSNPLSNLYNSTRIAMRNLEYTHDLTNLYYSKERSVANYLTRYAQSQGKELRDISFREFKTFVNDKDVAVKVHTIRKAVDSDNLTVIEMPLNTRADFQKCLVEPNVIITTDADYRTMKQFVKGKNVSISTVTDPNAAMKLLNTAMLTRKMSQLFFSINSSINNMIDASTKYMASKDIDWGTKANYFLQASKYSSAYESITANIQETYGNALTTNNIIGYFAEHADTAISLDDYMSLHANIVHAASGLSDSVLEQIKFPVLRLAEYLQVYSTDSAGKVIKDELGHAVAKEIKKETKIEMCDALIDAIDYVYKMFPNEVETSEYFLKTQVVERLKVMTNYTDEEIKALRNIAERYQPKHSKYFDKIISGIQSNAIVNFNSNVFSNIESRVRTATFLYNRNELGRSANAASYRNVLTQFDYSDSIIPDKMSDLFPYTQFTLDNLYYWCADAAEVGSPRILINSYKAAGYGYDTDEERMAAAYKAQCYADFLNGEFDTEEDTETAEKTADTEWLSRLFDTDYKGATALSRQTSGDVTSDMFGNHTLKTGSSFIDALSLVSLIANPSAIPDYIKGRMYSPLKDTINVTQDLMQRLRGDKEFDLNTFIEDNAYELADVVPVLGVLYNRFMSSARAFQSVNANSKSNGITWEDFMAEDTVDRILNITSILLPSKVTTLNEKDTPYYRRPIGYNYYKLSEYQKSNVRYIYGISGGASYVGKEMSTYISTRMRLLDLGYTKDEAQELMDSGWGYTKDERLVNYKKTFVKDANGNTPIPSALLNNAELYDEVLSQLVAHGLTLDEAFEEMCSDECFKTIGMKESMSHLQALADSKFAAMWNNLPTYITYSKGTYARTLRYMMKKLGLSYEEANLKMMAGSYLDEFNDYHDITAGERGELEARLEKQNKLEFEATYASLPEWLKYGKGYFRATWAYLKAKGVSWDSAIEMMQNGFCVQDDGLILQDCRGMQHARKAYIKYSPEQWNEIFGGLPEWIRYGKGAFKRTWQSLKAQGYTFQQALRLMADGYCVEENGSVINDCRSMRRPRKKSGKAYAYAKSYAGSSAKKYTYNNKRYSKAPKVKKALYSGFADSNTYTKYAGSKGATYGMKQIYRVRVGNSARNALKSAYPSSYRNIVFGYRRSLYKEHYAKYGLNRMFMRSGGWRMSSSPSVTKLRRKEAQTNKYRNRRRF